MPCQNLILFQPDLCLKQGMIEKMENERIISPDLSNSGEEYIEKTLRPQFLNEYIGQTKVKENMKIYIEAAKKRGEPLDHCLFYGPPGLGKTTISNIIANEMILK